MLLIGSRAAVFAMEAWTVAGVARLIARVQGENVARLAAGEPVRISAQQMSALGMPQMEMVIHYGRTEEDILAATAARARSCPRP